MPSLLKTKDKEKNLKKWLKVEEQGEMNTLLPPPAISLWPPVGSEKGFSWLEDLHLKYLFNFEWTMHKRAFFKKKNLVILY